jgi:DNA repair exonuclease SbcCD nuclease subunit
MRIAYMSDLHLEFGNPILPMNKNNADVLILAGDIFLARDFIDQNPKRRKLYTKFLTHIAAEFPIVIIIAGNHELYRWRKEEFDLHGSYLEILRRETAKYSNIRFLEKEYLDIGDVRFIGATLWTDFGNANPLIMEQARLGINDYRTSFYTPNDTLLWHRESMDFIRKSVSSHKKVVMISHMAPSFMSVHPMYTGQVMNSAFATELFEFISDHPQIVVWFHGHMHHTIDYTIGNTRVLTNPYGYHHHEENKRFDKNIFVDFEGDLGVKEVSEH